MSAHDPVAPAAPDYQGDEMKEIAKKDQPHVSGGAVAPDYPQVPCFTQLPGAPADGPTFPEVIDYPAPTAPTA